MAGAAVIVAGFGFRSGASAESLADALHRAAGGRAVGLLATAADKSADPAFQALALQLALPVAGLAAPDLKAQATQTQSAPSLAARGTGSLAEAAALAAAGPAARLVSARQISQDGWATCALAEGDCL